MNAPEEQPTFTPPSMPWLDGKIPEDAMKHLWEIMTNPIQEPLTNPLAGNISKSVFLQDKDNWFYENVLKEMSEFIYYRDSWSNFFEIQITKKKPSPIFKLNLLWVNYQKQHEFNPPHHHQGGIGYSFVVFMKIPTHWKDQHALELSLNSNVPCASDFQFLLGMASQQVREISIPLCPEDKGRILFFPSWLHHQVFPFYECEEERITISGNIVLSSNKPSTTEEACPEP